MIKIIMILLVNNYLKINTLNKRYKNMNKVYLNYRKEVLTLYKTCVNFLFKYYKCKNKC